MGRVAPPRMMEGRLAPDRSLTPTLSQGERASRSAFGAYFHGNVIPARVLCRGFTLLELLVVLAIATLLFAVTPPLISSAIPGVELKSSARRVTAGLRLAREEAIRRGRDVAFTLDLEARTFAIDGGFRDGKLPRNLDVKLEAAEREMVNDHVGTVRFFPDGSSTGGRIILARDDRGYQVGVQWLTGRIRMASWKKG